MPARILSLGGAVCLLACGAADRQIVETRDLPTAGSSPTITGVDDLGGMDVPANGELRPGRSDGVAVVGEVLWIHGRSFGRQPTVLVAGRPAAVLSRTGDGGILVRVPAGGPAGPQPVTVIQEEGRAERTVQFRRYAGLLGSNGVLWLALGADSAGAAAAGETPVPGARFLALSADGRAAYVAGERGPIAVIELPAPGRPAVIGHLEVGGAPIVGLTAASAAPVLAVVRESEVLLVDTSAPLRPVRSAGRPLPRGARSARPLLSPDGKSLALAFSAENRVAIVDLAHGLVTDVALAPETRAAVLVDLAFAPDGQTLWVAAGDTAESRPLGPQPTRVFAIRLGHGADGRPTLQPARTIAVEAASAPTGLATARSLPLASGATIRLPPERATVYLAAGVRGSPRSALFTIGAEDRAAELVAGPGSSQVGACDVTPDGHRLLAAALISGGGVQLLSAPAEGHTGPTRSDVLGFAAGGSAPPRLSIQP
jgi:hypothetical protein